MSLSLNHQTNSLNSNAGVVYFDSQINAQSVTTLSLSAELLSGNLAPSSLDFQLDAGGGYGLSPTFLPWLNTLTASTTIISTTSTTPILLTANKRFMIVVVVGAGGGGGAGISGNTSNPLGGLAGAAGCVLIDLWSLASASNAMPKYTAVIGAGGAAGTTTNALGGDGGTTTFSLYSSTFVTGDSPLYYLEMPGGYASSNAGEGLYLNNYSVLGSNFMYKDGTLGTGTNGVTLFAGYGGQASAIAAGGAGGNSASTPTAGAAGGANTGAGGGGGARYNTARSNGGAGGSGVVKIYYM